MTNTTSTFSSIEQGRQCALLNRTCCSGTMAATALLCGAAVVEVVGVPHKKDHKTLRGKPLSKLREKNEIKSGSNPNKQNKQSKGAGKSKKTEQSRAEQSKAKQGSREKQENRAKQLSLIHI